MTLVIFNDTSKHPRQQRVSQHFYLTAAILNVHSLHRVSKVINAFNKLRSKQKNEGRRMPQHASRPAHGRTHTPNLRGHLGRQHNRSEHAWRAAPRSDTHAAAPPHPRRLCVRAAVRSRCFPAP